MARGGRGKPAGLDWGLGSMEMPRCAFLLLWAIASACVDSGEATSAPNEATSKTARFLKAHWDRPLPPQGEADPLWPEIERSLSPGACGTCHTQQMLDWAQSRHARAMGPGLMGQYTLPSDAARQGCLNCHAPLAEQAASLGGEDASANHLTGLTCAGCHLRERTVYGPPPMEGRLPPGEAHGGFVPDAAFQDSAFCAACHQFTPGQLALNGKLLENTYEEWKSSPQGIAGKSCQSCHMPDRRHLWRGIHDPEMVRDAVEITVSLGADPARADASIGVRNIGAGHHFPTYVTPRVVLEACQVDGDSATLEGTCREVWFSREVTMDLKTETADTRLPAGEERVVEYRVERAGGAVGIRVRLVVDPQRFYREMFGILLDLDRGVRATLEQARTEAAQAVFTAWEEEFPF